MNKHKRNAFQIKTQYDFSNKIYFSKQNNNFAQPIDKALKMCYNNMRLKIQTQNKQTFRGVAQLVARQFRVLVVSCSTKPLQKCRNPLKTLDFSHFTHSEKLVKFRGWPHNWPQQNSILFYVSRRSEGGIAPVSGTGDRGFESRRFDHF